MAVKRKEVTVFACERCDHEWIPRDALAVAEPVDLPRVCPKCKSPYWNRPRTAKVTPGRPAAKSRAPKKTAKKKARAKRASKA